MWVNLCMKHYKHILIIIILIIFCSICSTLWEELTCNDGGGLSSDVVFVHILPIIQFTFHKHTRPETKDSKTVGEVGVTTWTSDILRSFKYSQGPFKAYSFI